MSYTGRTMVPFKAYRKSGKKVIAKGRIFNTAASVLKLQKTLYSKFKTKYSESHPNYIVGRIVFFHPETNKVVMRAPF